MARLTQFCTSAALATLIATTPALADLTAKEVRDNWQNRLTTLGFEVSFDEAMSAGILTINNLTLTMIDDDQQTSTITLGPVGYREQGDGSVEVILATDTPVTFKTGGSSFTFNQTHTGLSYIISGSPDAITHNIQADEISLNLTEMVEKGELFENAEFDLILRAVSGTSLLESGGFDKVISDFTIGEFAYDMDMKEPGEQGKVYGWNGSITNLHGDTNIVIPKNLKTGAPTELLDAGIVLNFGGSYGSINSFFSTVDGNKAAEATLASDAGSLEFSLSSKSGGMIDVIQKLALGAISLDFSIADSEKDENVNLAASIADIKQAVVVTVPIGMDPEKMPVALDAGLALSADLSHGAISGALSVTKENQPVSGTMSVASGDMSFALDRDMMRYGGRAIDTKMSAKTGGISIPSIEYSIGEASFNMVAPVNKSTTPAPFTIQYKIADLWVGEDLWSLFDPTTLLSHAPATINLDITGMGNWLIDIMDTESEEARNAPVKGELHALTLNALQVTGAGINLTGVGDFTFNNDDLETFDGVPAPTGAMHLKLTGGNALIDTLIEMGLMPADGAMGVRMALSLFTIAGDGDDTLISDLEITQDGQVLANGKRLK
ncbi:MAG: hypothetical protein L3J30_09300 [Marinosulfonomonas sp.]|nr:hypothetical protein [Marinosulfonomonas sp.]